MLVLSRKVGERIMIGNNIAITVVKLDGGKVKLGIDAPDDVPVNREEVLHREDQPNDIDPGNSNKRNPKLAAVA